MRTTIDLPDSLMRKAKATAAMKGQSLRTFFTQAISRELGVGYSGAPRSGRVALPLFGKPRRAKRRLTNPDLEQALADSESLPGVK